ncbi:histidinol dehydrogenase [Hyphobacterium marinum]|uniref:Histidinol dehydrogenase n=1 Tax=Hyphobacterium marinum TaxID=3116574 RepID=A0ABU7LYV1_9PROT|nr:histidinol dehydrogenase [Hyphobacterium sp. Y6023]MEE2566741.1 histidinol dehydrogenase [Hyphobacterium sp. Y6023]
MSAMLKSVDWASLDAADRERLFAPLPAQAGAEAAAVEIVEAIQRGGDAALRDYARRFDGCSAEAFRVPREALTEARATLTSGDEDAIRAATDAIRRFHELQGLKSYAVETWPGVTASRRVLPIGCAGLYVPAGSAPLVSTLLMLAIPAQIAGVPEIAVCVPPGRDGQVNAAILAAADLLGLENIFAVGGAQAIAAMAFGLGGVPKVDRIFGPGNAYVAAAKTHVAQMAGGPAIDLPAGPSEVMVMADGEADPDFVAADLLAQAEHDALARVTLVSATEDVRRAALSALEPRLAGLPREAIARDAMAASVCVLAPGEHWADVVNTAAPEHLILHMAVANEFAEQVRNAGAIFVGPWSPESMGDYAAGPNHTLPTGRAARSWSGVTVESFQKTITMVEASRDGADAIAPTVEALAALEGLDGHRQAMKVRRQAGEGRS